MEGRPRLYKGTGWRSSVTATWAFMTARFTATNRIMIYRLEIASIFTRGLLFRSTSNAGPRTPSGEIPLAIVIYGPQGSLDAHSVQACGQSVRFEAEQGSGSSTPVDLSTRAFECQEYVLTLTSFHF